MMYRKTEKPRTTTLSARVITQQIAKGLKMFEPFKHKSRGRIRSRVFRCPVFEIEEWTERGWMPRYTAELDTEEKLLQAMAYLDENVTEWGA